MSILLILLLVALGSSTAHADERARAHIYGVVDGATGPGIEFRFSDNPLLSTFRYQSAPLDPDGSFSIHVPAREGVVIASHGDCEYPLWLAPSLRLRIDGQACAAYELSGSGADDSRWLLAWYQRFPELAISYKDLEPTQFLALVNERLAAQLEFLSQGKEKYQLSEALTDYASAHFNYERAALMVGYPAMYERSNNGEWVTLPADYYDELKGLLHNEEAIGVESYRTFLRAALAEALPAENMASAVDVADSEDTITPARYRSRQLYERLGRDGLRVEFAERHTATGATSAFRLRVKFASKRRFKDSRQRDFPLPAALSRLEPLALATRIEKGDSVLYLPKGMEAEFETLFSALARLRRIGGARPEEGLLGERAGQVQWVDQSPSEALGLRHTSIPMPQLRAFDAAYALKERFAIDVNMSYAASSVDTAGAVIAVHLTFADHQRYQQGDGGQPETLHSYDFVENYDLARAGLDGQVRDWLMASEVARGLSMGGEAAEIARMKWDDFRTRTDHPEYLAALDGVWDALAQLQPGRSAPRFTVHDSRGGDVSLEDFRGRVVLLDFWATWCAPCITDLPLLQQLEQHFEGQPVSVVHLSLDDDRRAWRSWLKRRSIEGIQLQAAGFGSAVAQDYHVTGLPAYYLIDADGRLVERLGRIQPVEGVIAKIETALKSLDME